MMQTGEASGISRLVTDSRADPGHLDDLRAAGITVHVAGSVASSAPG